MGNEVLGLEPQYFWLIAAAVLGVVEILTITFFALPFAIAALLTAGFVWITNASFTGQLWFFTIASVIGLVAIQVWFRKWFLRAQQERELKSNVDALVGKQAVVVEEIRGDIDKGAVKIHGEIWSALAVDGADFRPGEKVYVHRVDGVKLLVGANPPPEQKSED